MTHDRYEAIVRQHLIPRFGQIRLKELKARDIIAYQEDTVRNRRRSRYRKLVTASLRAHHRALARALDYAVKTGDLKRNPCDDVPMPPLGAYCGTVLSDRDRGRLLRAATGHSVYVPMILALTAGLYRAEILALRWRDIDFKRRTITVAQVLGTKPYRVAFKRKKSRGSLRKIPLPAQTANALKAHKKVQDAHRKLLGPAYRDLDLVCARPIGIPLMSEYMTTAFNNLRDRLQIDVRFADLRHAHFAKLLLDGVPLKEVAHLAGHASIYVTRQLYDEFVRPEERATRGPRKIGRRMA